MDEGKPKVIKVAKVSKETTQDDVLRALATLCYYYPAYTLREARKLPYKHVVLMLSQARRLEAQRLYNETQIAAAPKSKKGQGVKKLSEHFKRSMKNG